MLIVGPNSACNICEENYMEVAGVPHTLPCGHIFCKRCLDQIQPQCPICRRQFFPQDILQLHVDSDPTSRSTTVAPQVDIEAQRLFEDIAEIANGRATTEEMRMVIDRFCAHYHSQLNDIPVWVINLLLSALMESQRKLSEVASTRDDVRDRLTMKLEAAQLRRRTLEQVHRTEKETAWRNEEALRSHCNEISAQSRSLVVLFYQQLFWLTCYVYFVAK
ncbi:hypothetical protein V8E55_009913 [Tylopilus felleus]